MEANVGRLEGEVDKMGEENKKMCENNSKLEKNVGQLEETRKKLEGDVNRMSGEVDRMAAENKQFEANNQKLEEEVGRFAEQNKQMATQVESLTETVTKFQSLNEKMNLENEKLARIRDDLKEQLAGFDQIKEALLGAIEKNMKDMDEKMKAMDRSLLEKIAAEIEFMDDDEGLSPKEFETFLRRVPANMKSKFDAISADFEQYDTDGDGVMSYDELTQLLDQVMSME